MALKETGSVIIKRGGEAGRQMLLRDYLALLSKAEVETQGVVSIEISDGTDFNMPAMIGYRSSIPVTAHNNTDIKRQGFKCSSRESRFPKTKAASRLPILQNIFSVANKQKSTPNVTEAPHNMTQVPSTATEDLGGFASIIASYEHRIGHACRLVAGHIPPLLTGLPSQPIILDNACGSGAATEELVKALPSARVYAVDAVPPMVQSMRAVVAANAQLRANVVEVEVMDGQALRYQADRFDASLTNFGVLFFSDPVLGVREVRRTLKPGGCAVFTVWKEFGFKAVLWEVQRRVGPADPVTELPLREAWCDGTLLRQTLQDGGFTSIEMTTVTEGMWGVGIKDLEGVLLENFEAMVARNWTEDEKAKLAAVTAQVLEDHEADFCIKLGDKVGVPMTAWVAICRK